MQRAARAEALGPLALDRDDLLRRLLITELFVGRNALLPSGCLLYTSDAADERSSVDLGGRRIIKKKI